jgi:hypothetical protein
MRTDVFLRGLKCGLSRVRAVRGLRKLLWSSLFYLPYTNYVPVKNTHDARVPSPGSRPVADLDRGPGLSRRLRRACQWLGRGHRDGRDESLRRLRQLRLQLSRLGLEGGQRLVAWGDN